MLSTVTALKTHSSISSGTEHGLRFQTYRATGRTKGTASTTSVFAVGNAYQGNRSVAWMRNSATRSYSALIAPAAAQDSTYTSAINDKGQVVGYFADTGGAYHGFLEQGGTYTTIDMPAEPAPFPMGSIITARLSASGRSCGRGEGIHPHQRRNLYLARLSGSGHNAAGGHQRYRGDLSGAHVQILFVQQGICRLSAVTKMMSTKIIHKFCGAGFAECLMALAWCQSAPHLKDAASRSTGSAATKQQHPRRSQRLARNTGSCPFQSRARPESHRPRHCGINNSGLVVGTYNGLEHRLERLRVVGRRGCRH